jgi:hypothetical protein
MYILLESRDSSGRFSASEEQSDPTWSDAERWIRSLDGVERSAVQIHRDDQDYLEVAAVDPTSRANAYVLTGYVKGESVVAAPASNLGTGGPLIVVRHDEVPEYLCVSLETALVAAQTFLLEGELNASLSWPRSSDIRF